MKATTSSIVTAINQTVHRFQRVLELFGSDLSIMFRSRPTSSRALLSLTTQSMRPSERTWALVECINTATSGAGSILNTGRDRQPDKYGVQHKQDCEEDSLQVANCKAR
jgi:hypothetical protein